MRSARRDDHTLAKGKIPACPRAKIWVFLVSHFGVVMFLGAAQFVRRVDCDFMMGERCHSVASPAIRHKSAVIHAIPVMYFAVGIEPTRILATY